MTLLTSCLLHCIDNLVQIFHLFYSFFIVGKWLPQELKAANLMSVQQLAYCCLEPVWPKPYCSEHECDSWCCQYCGCFSLQELYSSLTVNVPHSFWYRQWQREGEQRKSRRYYMVCSGFCSCWQTVIRKGSFAKNSTQRNRHRVNTPHWQV